MRVMPELITENERETVDRDLTDLGPVWCLRYSTTGKTIRGTTSTGYPKYEVTDPRDIERKVRGTQTTGYPKIRSTNT